MSLSLPAAAVLTKPQPCHQRLAMDQAGASLQLCQACLHPPTAGEVSLSLPAAAVLTKPQPCHACLHPPTAGEVVSGVPTAGSVAAGSGPPTAGSVPWGWHRLGLWSVGMLCLPTAESRLARLVGWFGHRYDQPRSTLDPFATALLYPPTAAC